MKTSFISRFLVIFLGYMPIHTTAQLVLPVEPAVLHYKNWNKRILSHGIQQTIPLSNGDTLYRSYPSLVDSSVSFSCIQLVLQSTGFPLGNELTKKANGHWTSLTRDSILLQWEFTAIPQHSWTVYQDSSNKLNGEYVGIDTINHFSGPLTIWKYKLSNSGSKFTALNNLQIWLSDYGILLCPDIRSFPYENTEVILTGFDSPTLKKGLHFSNSTYAPYNSGDKIAMRYYKTHIYHRDYPSTELYFGVHQLLNLLSTTPTRQTWLVNTRRYELDSGYISSDTSWSNDTLQLDILPYENGRIISYGNNRLVILTDSLSFLNNPDYAFERTSAQTYGVNSSSYITYYFFRMCNFGSQAHSTFDWLFKSDWGFKSYIFKAQSNQGGYFETYVQDQRETTYIALGNRQWGTPPPPTSIPPVPQPSAHNSIQSYPNPTANSLTIVDKTMDDKWVNVNVYNTEGRLVLQFEGRFPIQFDLADFKEGLYSARISDENGYSKFTRFVKINP